jgi:hypothetical protein
MFYFSYVIVLHKCDNKGDDINSNNVEEYNFLQRQSKVFFFLNSAPKLLDPNMWALIGNCKGKYKSRPQFLEITTLRLFGNSYGAFGEFWYITLDQSARCRVWVLLNVWYNCKNVRYLKKKKFIEAQKNISCLEVPKAVLISAKHLLGKCFVLTLILLMWRI